MLSVFIISPILATCPAPFILPNLMTSGVGSLGSVNRISYFGP
jgi:hypothetical protein